MFTAALGPLPAFSGFGFLNVQDENAKRVKWGHKARSQSHSEQLGVSRRGVASRRGNRRSCPRAEAPQAFPRARPAHSGDPEGGCPWGGRDPALQTWGAVPSWLCPGPAPCQHEPIGHPHHGCKLQEQDSTGSLQPGSSKRPRKIGAQRAQGLSSEGPRLCAFQWASLHNPKPESVWVSSPRVSAAVPVHPASGEEPG